MARTALVTFKAFSTSAGKYNPEPALAEVREEIRNLAEAIVQDLHYPPPTEKPNQRYERTNTLNESWQESTFDWSSRGYIAELVNLAVDYRPGRVYSGYVYGGQDTHQAWMHEGYWPNIVDVARTYRPIHRKFILDIMKRYGFRAGRK